MKVKTKAAVAATFASIVMLPALPLSAEQPLTAEMLRQGGYVLYMRHATTDTDYADQVSAKMGDCSTQRNLSERGWKEAETVGAYVDMLDIPVGAVYSSEYCRAWATAQIAFGKTVRRDALNFQPAEDYTPEQTAAMRGNIMPFLTKAPPDGYNTVIVGHDDPFEAATGIYPEPMGVVYVIKPGSGDKGFEVVGSISPDAWRKIADAAM
jgi:phosphohistidine phosphatase SixA